GGEGGGGGDQARGMGEQADGEIRLREPALHGRPMTAEERQHGHQAGRAHERKGRLPEGACDFACLARHAATVGGAAGGSPERSGKNAGNYSSRRVLPAVPFPWQVRRVLPAGSNRSTGGNRCVVEPSLRSPRSSSSRCC